MNERYFPGFRTEPLSGEEYFWKIQRVLFFALMVLGFMIDITQMRTDRRRAFLYLLLSLILGGFANFAGAMQYRAVSVVVDLLAGPA